MAEQNDKKNGGCMIIRCTCEHEFQDKVHGRKKRVHNQCNKGWRCTVCGSIR